MAKIIGTAIAPINNLNYFEGNAKKHDIGKIIESILLYGFFQTILVCKRKNQVLGGNGRLESLIWLKQYPTDAENITRELKARYGANTEINYPPDGITVKDGQWSVNVLEVETVSDEEAIAINLQDNFSVLDGGEFTALDKTRAFEVDALLEQLETLKVADYLPVSVDNDDLDLLLRELEEQRLDSDWEEQKEDEDELNDALDNVGKVESRVKLGEIWQLGRHRIACGDSTVEANVKALLGDRFGDVGMVWADPPYGFGLMKEGSSGKIGNSKVYTAIENDQDTECALKAAQLTLKLFDVPQIWWGANYFTDALPPSKCWIVWDKDHHGMTFADAELAWVSVDKPVRCFRHAWSGNHRASEQGEERTHINQKPVALPEWAFEKYGQSDDVIFDPFLGSAPSIIAAQKMEGDLTVYGFELSPDYCEVIIKRFENFTGEVAKKVGSL